MNPNHKKARSEIRKIVDGLTVAGGAAQYLEAAHDEFARIDKGNATPTSCREAADGLDLVLDSSAVRGDAADPVRDAAESLREAADELEKSDEPAPITPPAVTPPAPVTPAGTRSRK